MVKNRTCPHCKSNLNGDRIIDTFIEQGKSKEEALLLAQNYEGWEELGEENRWGREIGENNIRGPITYRCPDCMGKL